VASYRFETAFAAGTGQRSALSGDGLISRATFVTMNAYTLYDAYAFPAKFRKCGFDGVIKPGSPFGLKNLTNKLSDQGVITGIHDQSYPRRPRDRGGRLFKWGPTCAHDLGSQLVLGIHVFACLFAVVPAAIVCTLLVSSDGKRSRGDYDGLATIECPGYCTPHERYAA